MHDTFITNQSAMASLASRMKGEILRELKGAEGGPRTTKNLNKREGSKGGSRPAGQPEPFRQSEGGDIDSGGGKSGPKGGKKKKRKEGPSAWPDMPKMGKDEYAAFRKEVAESFPNGCIFFLASRCSKGSECQRAHEVPDGYGAIKAKYTQARE